MDRETMLAAAAEAKRFLSRVKDVERLSEWPITGTAETGALRRSSLDLTRALARMRKAT